MDAPSQDDVVRSLANRLHYISGELDSPELYQRLTDALRESGAEGVLFYLTTYGFASVGAFALVTLVRDAGGEAGPAGVPAVTVSVGVAVAASCAIPGFYRPVKIGRRRYVDGGVCSASIWIALGI